MLLKVLKSTRTEEYNSMFEENEHVCVHVCAHTHTEDSHYLQCLRSTVAVNTQLVNPKSLLLRKIQS